MKIAVIGAGISGLTAAHILSRRHHVDVYEAADYIGGHTNTVSVREGERMIPVDTGFIVFNDLNYPNLNRLFAMLGIESRSTEMSFSVRCERSGLEYNGSSLNQLFVQRRNLIDPAFWRMLLDVMRFHRHAPACLQHGLDEQTTVAEFVEQSGYSRRFSEHYLLPLGASLWSCPTTRFREFPMQFVLDFLSNHRMLQVNDRPVWRTVVGGSSQYVPALVRSFRDNVFLNTPVSSIKRVHGGVELSLPTGVSVRYDEVILATHADQSLAMLADADEEEIQILSRFPYQRNEVALHTDTAFLPRAQDAWASWNYRIPAQTTDGVSVTYNMNMLQGLDAQKTYCVSLNPAEPIGSGHLIKKLTYMHPSFMPGRAESQSRHAELIRRGGISYCGAYWGFGFHEDGVKSALAVCNAFDMDLAA